MKIEHDKLIVEPTEKISKDGSQLWRITSPCGVCIGNLKFTIPKGFEFDFASVPRFAKPMLSDLLLQSIAPAAHDYLYSIGQSKGVCDGAFLDLMRFIRVPLWQRVVATTAVSLFGWRAYNAHQRRLKRADCVRE